MRAQLSKVLVEMQKEIDDTYHRLIEKKPRTKRDLDYWDGYFDASVKWLEKIKDVLKIDKKLK